MFLFVSTPHSYLAESIGMNVNMDMKWVNSFNPEVYHIGTSPLLCRANQWIGFYIIETFIKADIKTNCDFMHFITCEIVLYAFLLRAICHSAVSIYIVIFKKESFLFHE